MEKNEYKTHKVLINNWNEERFDERCQDAAIKTRLLPDNAQHFKSLYRSEHDEKNSVYVLKLENGENAGTECPATEKGLEYLKKTRAFPGHQPLQDPYILNNTFKPFETTKQAMHSYPEGIDFYKKEHYMNSSQLNETQENTSLRKSKLSKSEYQLSFVNYLNDRDVDSKALFRSSPTHKKRYSPNIELYIQDIMIKIYSKCFENGTYGLMELGNYIRALNTNNTNCIPSDQFKKVLQDFGLNLTQVELDALCKYFDKNGDKQIYFNEFLFSLRNSLSIQRKFLIEKAFNSMSSNGSCVTLESIARQYNSRNHPKVIKGAITADQALQEFMKPFEGFEYDTKISRDQWLEYFTGISASYVKNEQFYEYMVRCWQL
jgi:hypothetical protein